MTVEWTDPPEPPLSTAEKVARELKTKPGEWARVKAAAPWPYTGWWSRLPAYGCEIKSVRINPDDLGLGPHDFYARYVGKVGPE